MVSIPDREMFSPPGGFGVAARDGGTGVIERDMPPASFDSFDFLLPRFHDFIMSFAGYGRRVGWKDLFRMTRTRRREGCCDGNCESAGDL